MNLGNLLNVPQIKSQATGSIDQLTICPGNFLSGNGERSSRRKMDVPYVDTTLFDSETKIEGDLMGEKFGENDFKVVENYCYRVNARKEWGVQLIRYLKYGYYIILIITKDKIFSKKYDDLDEAIEEFKRLYNEKIHQHWSDDTILVSENVPFKKYYYEYPMQTAETIELTDVFGPILKQPYRDTFKKLLLICFGKKFVDLFYSKHSFKIYYHTGYIDMDKLKYLQEYLLTQVETPSIKGILTHQYMFGFTTSIEENDYHLAKFYYLFRLFVVLYLQERYYRLISEIEFESMFKYILDYLNSLNDFFKERINEIDIENIKKNGIPILSNAMKIILETEKMSSSGEKLLIYSFKYSGIQERTQKNFYPFRSTLSIQESKFDKTLFANRPNHRYMWHGTGSEYLQNILQDGFLIDRGMEGRTDLQLWYGNGIYFTESANVAMNYAVGEDDDIEHFYVLLLCEIAVGDSVYDYKYQPIPLISNTTKNLRIKYELESIKDIDIIRLEAEREPSWSYLDNEDVKFPYPKFEKVGKQTFLPYKYTSEYIVTNTNFIQIRYIFVFQLKQKLIS